MKLQGGQRQVVAPPEWRWRRVKLTCKKHQSGRKKENKAESMSVGGQRVLRSLSPDREAFTGLSEITKRDIQSGMMRSLTAPDHYLLGKTLWKKHGERPSPSISPSGRAHTQWTSRVQSCPIILCFAPSLEKVPEERKSSPCSCPRSRLLQRQSPCGGWSSRLRISPAPRCCSSRAAANQRRSLNLEF